MQSHRIKQAISNLIHKKELVNESIISESLRINPDPAVLRVFLGNIITIDDTLDYLESMLSNEYVLESPKLSEKI